MQNYGRDTTTQLFVFGNNTQVSVGEIGSSEDGLNDTQAFWSKDGSVLAITSESDNLTIQQMTDLETDEQLRRVPPLRSVYDFQTGETVYDAKRSNRILREHGGRGVTIFKRQNGFDDNARPKMLWENY